MTAHFDFSRFPVLTTERLTLRELLPSDAEDVLAFRGDREVQRYHGPVFHDLEDVQSMIGELAAEYADHQGITWGITLTRDGRVLGLCSYHDWDQYRRRAEIGYDLARAYWGQGIASEAMGAIIRFGFDKMNLHHIYARTLANNHRSVSLLERLGFQQEGTRRQHSWEEDGAFDDSAIYGLVEHAYRTARRAAG
ncbi:MAG: GNAT family N-acetyltransferase [Anaerolineae bacterium]|nr:GNAT family N-acetyltransferase [Anaerolineae bacterium]